MGKAEGKLGTGPGQTQQAQDSPRSSPGQAWNRPGTGPGQVFCHIIQTARRGKTPTNGYVVPAWSTSAQGPFFADF